MIPEFPWLKLVGIRQVVMGECSIVYGGKIHKWASTARSMDIYTVVAPDNAYNVIQLEDLKIPEGHEPDGESLKDAWAAVDLRKDIWLGIDGKAHSEAICGDGLCGDPIYPGDIRLRLRKIKPKTKRVVVLESDDPGKVALYADRAAFLDGTWTVRFEDRPL